jgi:hypothetical protein
LVASWIDGFEINSRTSHLGGFAAQLLFPAGLPLPVEDYL